MDSVIYRNYRVNRRFFLFTVLWPHAPPSAGWSKACCVARSHTLEREKLYGDLAGLKRPAAFVTATGVDV